MALRPLNCLPTAAAVFILLGAFFMSAFLTIFILIAACGQTREQRPHWMQFSGFHTGTCTAILRFSYWVVPVGQVPSAGIWETLISSPLPWIILAVTSLTKSGASAGTVAGFSWPLTVFGILTSVMFFTAVSTAA